jgi:hypothetical protein
MNVRVAVFDGLEVEAGPSDPNFKILLGDVTVNICCFTTNNNSIILVCFPSLTLCESFIQVKGADIVIVDDLVDTAGTLSDMYAFIFYT